MSDLFVRLQGDLNGARKNQDKAATLVLGMVISEAKNKRIELRRDLTNDDVIDVIRKSIKRRRESVEMYVKGGREELADKERSEATLLEQYLPAQVGEDEIRAAVQAAIEGGAIQMGPLMGKLNPMFKGRADGSVVSRIAKEALAARG